MRKAFSNLLIFFAITFPVWSFACDQAVDPNKVMFFVDVNLSLKEVEAARKSACERGERFVLHPDDPAINKVRSNYYKYLTNKEYYDAKCDEDTPACLKLEVEVDKLKEGIDEFDYEPYEVNEEFIKSALKKIKEQNGVISTLIVSGHDGGGEVSGDLVAGAFTKADFFKAFDETFSAQEKDQLQSILLWGCYTGTYSETADWKSQFPAAKAIVGFYDSGPLAIRPSSANLMSDFLSKEEQLYTATDNDQLKRTIQSLDSILYVQPGMLINACSEDDMYYAHYHQDGRRKTFYFAGSDADKQCQLVLEEWDSDLKSILDRYLEGREDVPEVIRGSDIRSIYGLVRQNEKCFKDHLNVDANKVGLLLFWYGVSDNFRHKYSDLLIEAQKDLDLLYQEYEELDQRKKQSEELFKEIQNELVWELSPAYLSSEDIAAYEKKSEELKETDEVHRKIYELFHDPQKKADRSQIDLDMLNAEQKEYYQEMMWLHSYKRRDILQKELKEAKTNKDELTNKVYYHPFRQFHEKIKLPVPGKDKYMRKDMVEQMRLMNNLFQNSLYQKDMSKYSNLEKAYQKMDQLLYQLDPTCMNFLEWHEYNPNKPAPKNLCE